MSQIKIQDNPHVEVQQGPNVQHIEPRADLPPEMQNARPAKGNIFARVAAFLFGAGAGGGAFALGGGIAALSAVTASTVAVGVATGGAALLGGAIGVGLFLGIKALVNYFRRAPDPEPRLQNQPQQNLPPAPITADVYNNSVANAITNNGTLPDSLKQGADDAIARLRNIYGEDCVPKGGALKELLDSKIYSLVSEIRLLGDKVTSAQLGDLIEKNMRKQLALNSLEKVLQPICEKNRITEMCTNVTQKHPELLEALTKANSQAEVQKILADAADEIKAMVQLRNHVEDMSKGTVEKMISIIAQSLKMDPDAVAPFVHKEECTNKIKSLTEKAIRGKIDVKTVEQEFTRLAENRAKQYTDAFAAVDAAKGLSEAAKTSIKMEILTSRELPKPELFQKGIAAGQSIDCSALKAALDQGLSREEVLSIVFSLGIRVNEALQKQYSPEGWNKLTFGSPEAYRAAQSMAYLAMLDAVPGLTDALRSREDLHVDEGLNKVLLSGVNGVVQGGAMAANAGVNRVLQLPLNNEDFAKITKQTQILNTIKNADIPQDLKDRWIGQVKSGAIAEPAKAQALIENVPKLANETRPLMEQYIKLQSYAPDAAEHSAQEARAFAEEMSGWRNFNTTEDLAMAPVDQILQDDITGTLYDSQEYDRGISSQMKLDASRGTYTVNGEVLDNASGEEVGRAIRRAMPTEEATKMVSSIVNQRSFAPIQGLSFQKYSTGESLPNDVLTSMTKMATRDIEKGLLHCDLGSSRQAENIYKVTVENGKAHIAMSEVVGIDAGFGVDQNGLVKLAGKVRYTLHFECDLLGNDGKSPSIQSVHLEQYFLPNT